MKELHVIIVIDPCSDCGAPTLGTCEVCGKPICMECYRHYEWLLISTKCWKCKNEEDMKWLETL